eukprot:jgi/Ulvmu1/2124/UM127_0009.1
MMKGKAQLDVPTCWVEAIPCSSRRRLAIVSRHIRSPLSMMLYLSCLLAFLTKPSSACAAHGMEVRGTHASGAAGRVPPHSAQQPRTWVWRMHASKAGPSQAPSVGRLSVGPLGACTGHDAEEAGVALSYKYFTDSHFEVTGPVTEGASAVAKAISSLSPGLLEIRQHAKSIYSKRPRGTEDGVGARKLLHGNLKPRQYSKCSRCYLVLCSTTLCTGHCKFRKRLYNCQSRVGGRSGESMLGETQGLPDGTTAGSLDSGSGTASDSSSPASSDDSSRPRGQEVFENLLPSSTAAPRQRGFSSSAGTTAADNSGTGQSQFERQLDSSGEDRSGAVVDGDVVVGAGGVTEYELIENDYEYDYM